METAETLFAEISSAAGDKLVHPQSLQQLIAVALPSQRSTLFEIGFTSKFLVKTWNVMKRLGADDPTREQLKIVFQQELDGVKNKLAELALIMTATERTQFESRYLSMTSTAFVELLALLQDLAWVKNVEIDRR